MPYCRRCGTKLADDAHFCHKCGTPVAAAPPLAPVKPVKPMRKNSLVLAAVLLTVILIVAVFAAALAALPIAQVSVNLTNQDSHPDINSLNLNFQADIADINIVTESLNGRNILVAVTANGARGIFGSENPLQVTFSNETAGDVLTVTSTVSQTSLFAARLQVACTIYVNPALHLNLNITSGTGQVSLTADKHAALQSLNLKTTTGEVQANLQNITVKGDISLATQTGTLHFRMYQTEVGGNRTVNLQTNTGAANMDITQTRAFGGNLQVNASTTTGPINVDLDVDNDVGAKIISHTDLGNIRLQDVRSFSGNKSPIQSSNYPSESNIEINNKAAVGDINIKAIYQSAVTPTMRN